MGMVYLTDKSFFLMGIHFISSPVHYWTTRHQFQSCYVFSIVKIAEITTWKESTFWFVKNTQKFTWGVKSSGESIDIKLGVKFRFKKDQKYIWIPRFGIPKVEFRDWQSHGENSKKNPRVDPSMSWNTCRNWLINLLNERNSISLLFCTFLCPPWREMEVGVLEGLCRREGGILVVGSKIV